MIPKGKLLIIGGAEDKGDEDLPIASMNTQYREMEILRQLLPTNKNGGRIEVITTATDMPDEVREMYEKAFAKIGYKNTGFMDIQDKMQAREEEYLERIGSAQTILFTGGDQFKIATIIGGTPIADAIYHRYKEDKDFTVAGTSAGAMVLSKIMIQGGGVHEALFETDLRISSGLGLLRDCIVDTHFIKRGRFGRLAHAVIVNPGQIGIGLGEDTALIIKKGHEAECFGSGMVVIVDGRYIEQTNIASVDEGTPIYVENLKVHVLVKGCVFDIRESRLISERKPHSKDKK
jgi:cyanophycinase